MNHFLRLTLLAALLASPAAFTGCSSSKTTNTSTGTVGQQLIDLDRAYKDGVITKEQYDKMKKEIIRRHD
jgi:membrane peptidoglycan carboxypeptidase